MTFDPTKDDTTTGTTPGNYGTTGVPNQLAILRKINLNVDIATQDELNAAYNDLSTKIATETSAYIPADQQLCSDLQAWAKGAELSGALHNEIIAETDRAETAEEAIRADLSNNYKVTVVKDDTPETSAYIASYTIKQGETVLSPKINIPKDYVVKNAALCTVTEAGVPYPEAEVGDKYIDFIVNTADSADEKHIYLPVKDLVDVYTGGTTEFATVNVDSNRVITTNISANIISAAAVTTVIGTSANLSVADTIWGAKKYAESLVAGKNVDAEGDVYVSASAADNKVTVAATAELCAAVANANAAVQDIIVDSNLSALINVQDEGTQQTFHGSNKLTAAIDLAENALTSVNTYEDINDNYASITIEEIENHSQPIGITLVTADISSDTAGLAVNTDVKSYVDTVSAAIAVTATGDNYVSAWVENGKNVKLAATQQVKDVVAKVQAASADWDSAEADAIAAAKTYTDTVSAAIDTRSRVDSLESFENNVKTGATSLTKITEKAISSYVDIDEIISELESLKAKVKNFASIAIDGPQ